MIMDSGTLKAYLLGQGASLVGVADLAPFKEEAFAFDPVLLEPYTRAVSIAVALEDEVIDKIDDRPTERYAGHYREINKQLDALAARAMEWIIGEGFRAQAVPASQLVSEGPPMGALSHKAMARMAGLGWQGKSLLIVTPEYGPRVRLVTVLTDMPLKVDGPIKNLCAACAKCAEACPVGAIKNVRTKDRYATRDDAIDLAACNARSFENFAVPEIAARICGVCVRACPRGKKSKRRGKG
jgi:epoxyqueuosine reductase